MSRRSMNLSVSRKSSLLATVLAFAAIGSTVMPAAALPQHFASLSAHPAVLSAPAPTGSAHPLGAALNVPPHAPSAGTTLEKALKQPPHQVGMTLPGAGAHIGNIVDTPPHQVGMTLPGAGAHIGNIVDTPPHQVGMTLPGAGAHIGNIVDTPPHQVGMTLPGAGAHIGNIVDAPPHQVGPTLPSAGPQIGGIINQTPNGPSKPVDDICPFNPLKCQKPDPAPTPSKPSGGPSYPSGGAGPVVIFAPPSADQAPGTVVTAAGPAATIVATRPATAVVAANPAPVATEPCNCLTKQYLDDGSVLFRDICTKEAAMATPAEEAQIKASMAQ